MKLTTGIAALAFATAAGCGTTAAENGGSGSGTTGSHGTTNGSSAGTGGSSTGSSSGGSTGGSSSSGGSSTGGGSTTSGGSSGGAPCQSDADCTAAGTYCDLPLNACPGTVDDVTAGSGSCHRDCFRQGCSCVNDADCPGSTCQQGTCLPFGVDCIAPNCTPDCPQASFTVDPCPVCLCQSCPAPDAGAPPVCGYSADAGSCGASQICCDASGGAALPDGGGVHSQFCSDLGPDGGCPPGASCGYDDAGAVASCNFYYP